MADVKISALPAATTPLAGTEVLPIVQGTSTVKVANNDLRPKQIQSNATSGVLQITGPAAASTRVMTVPDANFSAARTDAAQSFTGDQTLSTGNLVIGTSGKGIDFSVTSQASGMSSELLTDYEEGTWTPVYHADGVDFAAITMVSTARYTKVGRQVTIVAYIRTSNLDTTGASGGIYIDGLPYTSAASGQAAVSLSGVYEFVSPYPMNGYVETSSTKIWLQRKTALNGQDTPIAVASMFNGTAANKNLLILTATYFV